MLAAAARVTAARIAAARKALGVAARVVVALAVAAWVVAVMAPEALAALGAMAAATVPSMNPKPNSNRRQKQRPSCPPRRNG